MSALRVSLLPALLLVTGAVGSILASAPSRAADPGPIPSPELRLNLGPDAWEYLNTSDPLDVENGRTPRLLQDANLFAVISTDASSGVCFLDKNNVEWIGSCASGLFNGRVTAGQSLTIDLTPDFAAEVGEWSRAIIPFNTKQNVIIDGTTQDAAGNTTSSFSLFTGTSVDSGAPSTGTSLECASTGSPDSSPDSDKGANCVLDIEADAVKIVLEAREGTGDFSLGGENEIARFIFQIEPDGVINCSDKNSTIAVGDGINVPFAQCTRLDNVPSTLPGREGTVSACVDVNYSLTTAEGEVSLLHGLAGDQDPTQFRFLCTVNWQPEAIVFGMDGYPVIQRTIQGFGLSEVQAIRDLDFCQGAEVITDPAQCEPGTVAVTSEQVTFPTTNTISVGDRDLSPAFQVGDVIEISGTSANDGIYAVSAFISSSELEVEGTPFMVSTTSESATIRRLSGCDIVDFDFAAVTPADMEPSTDNPGDQKGCLLEQRQTECSFNGSDGICLEQTWGWEGDARLLRSF